MKQIQNRKAIKLDLLMILALLIVARISCPALSNIPIFNMAFTFIYGAAFVFIYMLTVGKLKRKDFFIVFFAALFAVYILLRGFFAGRGLFAREAFNAYIIVFLTMIYVWLKEKSLETKALFFKLIVASLIFNYLYSIFVLINDPGASRTAAALGVLERSPYDFLNAVGSFDAVYGGISVVLILIGMRNVLKKSETKNRLPLLVLILALVFIVMAAYGTSLVLLLIALSFVWMEKSKIIPVLIIPLSFLLLLFHEQFGQVVINISNLMTFSETASEKLRDVGEMIKTFEAAGTYAGENGRAARMLWSLESFKNHPIFGGIGISGSKVGGHSEILDMLGNFGLVGFALISAYIVHLYKIIKHDLVHSEMKSCWKIIISIFVISAILNPSLYSLQMFPLILMIPLAPSYIEMCENKKIRRNYESYVDKLCPYRQSSRASIRNTHSKRRLD